MKDEHVSHGPISSWETVNDHHAWHESLVRVVRMDSRLADRRDMGEIVHRSVFRQA